MTWLISYPPLRIVTLIAMIMLGVSMKHTETLLLLLVYGLLLLAVCGVPMHLFWQRLRLALPFIAFSIVFFPIYDQGMPGFVKALTYSTRLIFSLQMLTLLFYRLSLPAFFQALLRLKIPEMMIELILFTLRFMEVIRDEAIRMLQAAKSRGMKLRRLYALSSYLILSRLIGSLLLRSLHRSERIYMGMMSRGYQGILPHNELVPATPMDRLMVCLWALPVLILFLVDMM